MSQNALKLKIIQQISRCQDPDLLQTIASLLDQMGEEKAVLPSSLTQFPIAEQDTEQEEDLDELRDSIKSIFGE